MAHTDRCRVAVSLNNGASVQILCSRAIRMTDLAARVWAQVGHIGSTSNRLLARHFSFLLESVSVSDQYDYKYWLPITMTLAEVKDRFMEYPGCPVSAWRYRLRLRYYPDTYREIVETNEVFANYFYSQLCEDVHSSTTLSMETALKLGAFEARRILANLYTDNHKKSRIESLIREIGLDSFFPKGVFADLKPRHLKKLLLQQLKTTEGLTQEECVLNYIGLCYHHGNIIKQEFQCMHEGKNVVMGVCPTRGLVFHSETSTESLPGVPFCIIKELSTAVMPDTRCTLKVEFYHKKNHLVLTFDSLQVMCDIVSLIDGYCQCVSKDPIGSLYTSAEFSVSEEPMVKAGALTGMPKNAYAPCDSRMNGHNGSDAYLFVKEPDYCFPTVGSPKLPRPRTRSKISVGRLTSFDSGGKVPNEATATGKMRQRSSPRVKTTRTYSQASLMSSQSSADPNGINFDLVDGADAVPTIIPDTLDMAEVIGEGRFGQVRAGMLLDQKVQVAVKTCKSTCTSLEKQKFILEAVTMNEFDHPHIIRLIGVLPFDPYAIVMEHAAHGELRNFLLSESPPVVTLIKYCDQLSTATAYLETLGFVHRDIAARNVLVCTPELVKLGDFGLSRWVAEDLYYKASTGVLPIKWMAPESINFRRFTTASDVWMFAVCMWEILSYGAKPFTGIKNVDVLSRLEDNERPAKPTDCPDSLYQLFMRCWTFESSDRPTFATIREVVGEIFLAEGGAELTPQIAADVLRAAQARDNMQPRLTTSSAQLMAEIRRCSRVLRNTISISADEYDVHQCASPGGARPPLLLRCSTASSPTFDRPALALPGSSAECSALGGAGDLQSLPSSPRGTTLLRRSTSDIDARPPASLPCAGT